MSKVTVQNMTPTLVNLPSCTLTPAAEAEVEVDEFIQSLVDENILAIKKSVAPKEGKN